MAKGWISILRSILGDSFNQKKVNKMTLEEYIAKYRRGNNALTSAEAKIAGIAYPMPSGWVKRYRLLEVDGEAMHEAKLQRHRALAAKKEDGPKKPSKKKTKKELHAQLKAMQALLADAQSNPAVRAIAKPKQKTRPKRFRQPKQHQRLMRTTYWKTMRSNRSMRSRKTSRCRLRRPKAASRHRRSLPR